MTENGFPSSMQTSPAAPLTSTGSLRRPRREKLCALRATCSTPRSSTYLPDRIAPPSPRRTTSWTNSRAAAGRRGMRTIMVELSRNMALSQPAASGEIGRSARSGCCSARRRRPKALRSPARRPARRNLWPPSSCPSPSCRPCYSPSPPTPSRRRRAPGPIRRREPAP
jgi:hypothetical protein